MRYVLVAENDPDVRTMLMASATPAARNAVRAVPTTVDHHARAVLHTTEIDLLVVGAGAEAHEIAAAAELVLHAYRYHPRTPVVVLAGGTCEAAGLIALPRPVDFPRFARVVGEQLTLAPAARTGVRFSGLLAALATLGATAVVHARSDEEESAVVAYTDGVIVEARCGPLTGADALERIQLWTRPRVALTMPGRDEIVEEPDAPRPERRRRSEPRTNAPILAGEGIVDQRAARARQAMHAVMQLPGAIALALIDATSGLVLSAFGTAIKFDIAGPGLTTTLESERDVLRRMQLDDRIEDIMITLGAQYHLLRPVSADGMLFLYLALRRESANLASARMALKSVEQSLGLAM